MEGRFSHFAHSAQETQRRASRARDMSFSSLVKVDHVIYKQRAYMAINAQSDSSHAEAVAVNHEACRLGRWYQTSGRETFGETPTFASLVRPHAAVHDGAHEVLALLGNDWARNTAIQERILASMARVETASQEIMVILDRLVEEKHGPG